MLRHLHDNERGKTLKPVRVGICGLGTVGGGTFNVLTRNADEIARRAKAFLHRITEARASGLLPKESA